MKSTNTEARDIVEIAKSSGIESAALFAVIEVESNGVAGEIEWGQNGYTLLPTIRFEGHYFDRLLSGEQLEAARAAGLANPKAGAVKNPKTQKMRWNLFHRAAKINREAAIMSMSFGVGQVMGAHWKRLGYTSAEEFMQTAVSGLAGQVEMMVRYIIKFGLVDELKRLDFFGFARGYNGPNFKKYSYDTKLKTAYDKYKLKLPTKLAQKPTDPMNGMLKIGSRGARVREVQALLVRAGHSIKVDGDFGIATRDTLKVFQKRNGLTIDGVVGPETMQTLITYRTSASEKTGELALTEIPEVRNGGIAAFGGATGGVVAADKISGIADQVGYTGISVIDYVVTGLYLISGIIVVGGLVYAGYHYLKSKKTVTQ